MTTLLDDLRAVLKNVFNDPDLEIKLSTTAKDVEGWDSLMHVRLILTIEKTFNVRFSASEASSFENISDILRSLEQKKSV